MDGLLIPKGVEAPSGANKPTSPGRTLRTSRPTSSTRTTPEFPDYLLLIAQFADVDGVTVHRVRHVGFPGAVERLYEHLVVIERGKEIVSSSRCPGPAPVPPRYRTHASVVYITADPPEFPDSPCGVFFIYLAKRLGRVSVRFLNAFRVASRESSP